MSNNSIVITGCSSGFGRITAIELAQRGWHVFASIRKAEDQTSLLAEAAEHNCKDNLTPIICDITDNQQVTALAQTVAAATPQLTALLNNAGTAFAAPVELLALDDLRAQLEVNVVAQVAVTQALLPLLKAAYGTIINVSSVSGRIATPVTGAYSASKFAIEALSDALRVEMAPFGVRVVLIEPTSSPTNIWKTSLQRSLPTLEQHRKGPYGRLLNLTEKVAQRSSQKGFPPMLFAQTVVKILESRKPRARYIVPPGAAREVILRKLLPDSLWDALVRRMLHW